MELVGVDARSRSFPGLDKDDFLWVELAFRKTEGGRIGTRNRGKGLKARQHPHCRRKQTTLRAKHCQQLFCLV